MVLCVVLAAAVAAAETASPTTREMERINWMEFREWVPSRIETVLLPLGTLEGHGVIANGADIVAPLAIARAIAPRLNALIAPVVPYGFTGSMDAYPGAFTVPEDVYRAYVRSVLQGLARNKFRNIVLINGAQAKNVYWLVGSSATLGTGSQWQGNILALTSITLVDNATLFGRALARNGSVTLGANNVITLP